jgi:signal transduction histidine kinase/ligand-binding sensor domain-containing protein/class 3 adenylate cyclase/DNA-binding NarL/FixJ family response regulator
MLKIGTLFFKKIHFFIIQVYWILLVFFPTFSLSSQTVSNLEFEHLSVEQGLSNVVVNCIFQDKQGYIWIGTGVGLNRYDGNIFKIFNNNPDDPKSLSHDFVLSIFEDSKGTLWVGTSEGLNSFNPQTEEFKRHHFLIDDPDDYSFYGVQSIFEDSKGTVWFGTYQGLFVFDELTEAFLQITKEQVISIYEDAQSTLWIGTWQGLEKYDAETKEFSVFQNDPNDSTSLSDDIVNSIFEDSRGNLWIGTASGLNQFDRKTKKFQQYFYDPDDPGSLSDNQISSIFEDSKGNLWIGTGTQGEYVKNGGLNRFVYPDKEKGTSKGSFEKFFHDPNKLHSLSDNIIRTIYEDRQGILWIGTYGNGINTLAHQTKQFTHHFKTTNNSNCLSNNTVWSIYEDHQGILWIGTANGLNSYDPKTKKYSHYFHDSDDPESIGNGSILSIFEDREGELWFGVGSGLSRFDRQSNQFFHYKFDPSSPNSPLPGTVRTIYEDDQGLLWLGTFAGMTSFDKKTGEFQHFTNESENENSLSSNNVFSITGGDNGTLWIGTGWGLNHFDPKNNEKQFLRYYRKPDIANSLSSSRVSCVLKDRSGIVWAGTWGGGLNKFNPKTNLFTRYKEEDGLPSDWVWGILEDDHGKLWISTSRGLSRFYPKNEVFRNYDTFDGLQSYEFNQGAYHKSAKGGKMYFGGVKGFNAFHPDSLENNPYVPPIVFSSFKYYQKDDPEGKAIEVIGANILDKLVLNYNENSFTCEFSALNFHHSFKNQYAYKLEGIHDSWINIGTKNEVTFANLSPGNYTLQIIGSNNNSVWNKEGASLKIVIKPPFWLTIWAKIIYVLVFLSIVYYFWQMQVQKQQRKLESEQRKLEQEKRINEQLRKVDQLKDQFLANTSHELRSPLNGIIGLATSLKDGIAGSMSEVALKNLNLIIYSGKRLANLVNDILDFSKLRNGELVLQKKPTDLCTIVESVLALSRPLINAKPIELINAVSPNVPFINADENRLQQILHNLVGNGIKFTDEGFVKVAAKIQNNMLAITVSDSGKGIPDNQMDSIFKAFEQGDGSLAREYEGTGLGLSVTKQIVELHGGIIQVQSGHGIGSHFTFTIPLSESKDHKSRKSLSREEELKNLITEPLVFPSATNGEKKYPVLGGDGYEPMKILIVDDDPVNRQVLENFLFMEGYQVQQATCGQDVLDLLESGQKFDLLILDIMMPGMSGYSTCEKIRKKHLASDLPIIMLTAKNQITDLVEGFNVGANDFLTKPFSKEELISRIKTHLNLQRIQKATNRFVPYKFLKTIGHQSITDVKLGDQANCDVTVFFSDIRDYMTLSEQMTPEENFKFVNAFVGRMGPIIQKHNGFVNQYLGDAIMANFPAEAEHALQAAVDMQKTLRIYNEQRKLKNRRSIKVGMGLHTGSLIMGIIGDENRTEPATVSSTVNTASRMESLTKYYGANILISEHSKRKIPNSADFHFRYLGKVQLKGKKELISVYECFDGDAPILIEFKNETLPQFNKGLDYFFARDFEKAAIVFKNILDANSSDLVCRFFLERAIKHAKNGVSDTWNGIEVVKIF